jgi:hypothetical protein
MVLSITPRNDSARVLRFSGLSALSALSALSLLGLSAPRSGSGADEAAEEPDLRLLRPFGVFFFFF